VNLGHPPKIIARPSPDIINGRHEPAVKLPIKVKVSDIDPEVYVFRVTGPDCFCEWKLAIDWTNGGRSGTTLVDHGFGKIRSDTKSYNERPLYTIVDGEWQEM
jgi:hypothetical protein